MELQDWTFGGLWPYEPKWFESADGRLHFVDEGSAAGAPIVFAHGNPAWSFIYRDAISRVVGAGHRAIAIDHLGFGRSDKPVGRSLYSIERHADRFAALIDTLEVRDAIVVVHDWGGPIGLDWAVRNPDRVAGIFVLNTFAHRPPGRVPLPLPIRLFRAPLLGELMVKRANLFTRGFLFHAGTTHPERFRGAVRQAYLAPHPTWASRTGMLEFPRQIPKGPDGEVSEFCAEIESRLEARFTAEQVRILWGERDVAFTEEMLQRFWLKSFPGAEVTRLVDAAHFVQEDAPDEFAEALVEFVEVRIAACAGRRSTTTGT